jgi:hypothetical protein
MLGRAERHVLEVVRESRAPAVFIARAGAIEHLHAHDGKCALEHDQLEAVVEAHHRRLRQIERGCGDGRQRAQEHYERSNHFSNSDAAAAN